SRRLPEISPASKRLRHPHGPTLTERSARIACFAQARINIIACSATDCELTSPTTQSGIRRRLSAATSTESEPTQWRETIFSLDAPPIVAEDSGWVRMANTSALPIRGA